MEDTGMAQTILYGNNEETVDGAGVDGERVWIPIGDLTRATGWELKPEGLCQGEVCVPIPADRKGEWIDEKRRVDLTAFASHLGEAVVHDAAHAVWSFGPAARGVTVGGAGPVAAPDFTLPDLDGKLHSLSAYRGRKVLLFCWASW
jgi:AhpC/TSA family